MSTFSRSLKALSSSHTPSRWLYVPYDQLSDAFGPLSRCDPRSVGIVLIETTWKPAQRLYHKQKLALLLSAQRHFALEQARKGVTVRYLFGQAPYAELLAELIEELGPLEVMEPAERELRAQLAPLVSDGRLTVTRHEGWLTERSDFLAATAKKKTWRMDAFYRVVRKRYEVLLDDAGKPLGGKWSHDADNRRRWPGDPAPPPAVTFTVDPVTAEVCEMVQRLFAHHPGRLVPEAIPATLDDVERVWERVKTSCMTHFGPFEDAMSREERLLFHAKLSGLLNLNRISARRVLDEILDLDIPLNSKEGFVRQVLGWREFVRHVHRETDGFRQLPEAFKHLTPPAMVDTPPHPSALSVSRPLPDVFWGQTSGLECLDHVVTEVWEDAYTHHINRLMVLGNWATLLDISPRELSDWFWVAFEDAYDWVVEPNVLGMATFGLGELMVTKPYVSGSGYIRKMGDYCDGCRFDPQRSCPMTSLYWNFLDRHQEVLNANPRLRIVMAAQRKRSAEKKARDASVFEVVTNALTRGERLDPDVLNDRAGVAA